MPSPATRRSEASTPGSDNERPHPVHASIAESYMRTVSRSAASRKATEKPAVAIVRTSATSSTLWWATDRQPPASTSTPRRAATH